MIVITLARKPLAAPTIAANVLAHGTGGLAINASRIGTEGGTQRDGPPRTTSPIGWRGLCGSGMSNLDAGRYPANLILSAAKVLPECKFFKALEGDEG